MQSRAPIPTDADIIDLTNDDDDIHVKAQQKKETVPQWYDNMKGEHPFKLRVKMKATRSSMAPYTQIVFFPWDGEMGLDKLWNDEVYYADSTDETVSTSATTSTPTTPGTAEQAWYKTRTKWANYAALCGNKTVRIMHMLTGKLMFQVGLSVSCKYTFSHVCWAIDPRTLHPLLLYVHSSVLHVFDAEAKVFLGCIRGHGGDITSLGVHLRHPHLVYTTSRDCTSRIYDFRVTRELWTGTGQVRRDAFGMLIDDAESDCALGRCVVILTGGRSGGHEAAVLGADFHSSLPLIATCGMDHAVRIWHLGPALFKKERFQAQGVLDVYREDKPLFSSTTIHDARVLSVYWLSQETLLSHSAPRIRLVKGRPVEANSGTIMVWQWLSVARFFPAEDDLYKDPPLRGCISDYRESSSYKLISCARLPEHAERIILNRHVHRPPLVMIPVGGRIVVVNTCHLPVRPRPVMVKEGKDGTEMEEVIGWSLNVDVKAGGDIEGMEVEGCEMSGDGRIVAGVGDLESVWIWTGAGTQGNN